MKCTKMTVAAVAAVLALAMTGCKYADDDSAGKNGSDVVKGAGVESDLGSVVGGDGTPATEVPFDQNPNYARCTDVDFAPVYFGFDASNLAAGESAKIEAVASHLQSHSDRVVIVEGNCDERGSNEYNMSLGDLRAISIRDYLVTLGIDAKRVQTKSYGEEKPAVSGSGEEAWSKNRRGEFAIFRHK